MQWLDYLEQEEEIKKKIKAHSMNNYAEITIWGIIGFLIGLIIGFLLEMLK